MANASKIRINFYLHPIAVAEIVLVYNKYEDTVLGALSHNTVEDTLMILKNPKMIFGKEITST